VTPTLASLVDSPALGPRPFLTWYGAEGERIELSGAVTANWVAKTVNLLVEELDAGPGTLIRIDLPPHWRTAVWALAIWRTGAGVVLDGSSGSAGALVTDRPAAAAAGELDGDFEELLAQVLPSLARSFDGELPRGAIDAARVVGGFGDVVGFVAPPDPGAPAVVRAGTTTTHAELEGWASELPAGARLAVRVGSREPAELEAFAALVLGALRAGTSLVLLAGEQDLERICASERAEPWG